MGVVRFLNVSGLLIILLFASGCASIVSKTSYPVTIRSQPPGADVEIKDGDGKLVRRLKTPSSVVLKAGDGFFKPAKYNFKFSKSGYNPTSSKIAASLDGWYVGNVVFGGLIGILIVDPATGAMYKLDDTVQATLVADEDSGVNLQSQPANEGGDGIELKFDPAEHPHLGSTAAVLTFDARGGLPSDTVALLSERFSVELGNLGVYRLISRSKMKEVLEMQEFSAACTSTDCAVEAGQLLGVEYMIYGSIGKIGQTFTVNVYVTYVETGSVVAGATLDYEGKIDGLLTEGMAKSANSLVKEVVNKSED